LHVRLMSNQCVEYFLVAGVSNTDVTGWSAAAAAEATATPTFLGGRGRRMHPIERTAFSLFRRAAHEPFAAPAGPKAATAGTGTLKMRTIATAAAVLMLGIAGAAAGELPAYEISGLPATPLQMAVLGRSGETQERAATPTLMRDGMPASPHQIAVLTPRAKSSAQLDARTIETAASQVQGATRSE
jgi:hypothetical protein